MGERPKVYLAGPISGCNDEQRRVWRAELKAGFSDEFEFIDPIDRLMGDEDSDQRLVETDIECIRTSDAVLANLWKESMGTAFGLAQAHMAGKFVAVADPNYIRNRMVAFYADAVERTVPAALNRIRRYLQSEALIEGVKKADGTEEGFEREKLLKSIRKACLAARQSDLGPPRAIVMRTLDQLLEGTSDARRVIPTSAIRDAVFDAIAELASEPISEVDYNAIRLAWQQYDGETESETVTFSASAPAVVIHDKPLDVRIHASGTHSTIWGNGTSAIPSDAMAILKEMCRVSGVSEIRFGVFRETGSSPQKAHVRLSASKTLGRIEGKFYSRGRKGSLQTFQVYVPDPSLRDSVLRTMQEHLYSLGMVRTLVDE